jgi:hypothetical protein
MQNRELNSLPPFPVTPRGVPRRSHLPTIEASLRYWESVHSRAVADDDFDVARTATGLTLALSPGSEPFSCMEVSPRRTWRPPYVLVLLLDDRAVGL